MISIYIKKEQAFPAIAQGIVFSGNCKLILNSKFTSVACISLLLCYRAGDTKGLGAIPPSSPLTFLRSKRKKRNKEKEKVSMQKLLKDSPICKMSLFQPFQSVQNSKNFLSPKLGDRQYFPVFHGPCTLKSISSALRQPVITVKILFSCLSSSVVKRKQGMALIQYLL